MHNPEITSELRNARRRLEGIKGYELLKDLYWDQNHKSWVIHIRLRCDIPLNDYVPSVTQWYVLINQRYPDGTIRFFPDKHSSITHTFQHQNYNSESSSLDWRSGDPCLNTSNVSWGRNKYSIEPRESIDRLKWHVLRCLDWIVAAATISLTRPGDPFEFPALPSKTLYRIVFNEDASSFQNWITSNHRQGIVELKTLEQSPKIYAVFNFLGHEKESPEIKWGSRIAMTQEEDQTAIWLMLDSIPVIPPWQIPESFSDLLKVCNDQGYNLRKETSNAYLKIRRKEKFVRFVIIGFPVAKRIGDTPSLIHWFAFEFANPSKLINGFKTNSEARFKQELNILMAGPKKIKWVPTENWNKEQLTARGILPQSLTKVNVLLVGAGALGSILAEQLIRLGCEKISIVDDDVLTAGNMSRHTLSLPDIGKPKSEALSNHLNSIFPFVNASFDPYSIQETLQNKPKFFDDHDIIFDVTASDSTLQFLSAHLSKTKKIFISVLLGFNAERLYCFYYTKSEDKTIEISFHQYCSPWLQKERESFPENEEIVEGIGCWHPLFPSRLDDIQMLTSAAVKVIESDLSSKKPESFTVIEKQYDENKNFSGIKVNKVSK